MFTRDFVYLGASALQVVLTAVITPILTRRLSVGEYGQLALCVVVAQILAVSFSLGLPFAAQKVFAGEDGDRRSRGVLAISTVLALAASLVVVLAAPAWGPAVGLYRVVDARLAAVSAALLALTLTSLAMLRSREKLRMAIIVAALQSLGAQATGVLLLYVWAPTVANYLCGLIIGQGTAALVGLLALRPDWSALAAIRRYRATFLFGLPMVPQQLSGFILFAGDRIVIRHILGSAAVGRYSVAYNVGSLGFLLLIFVNQAWMPRIYALADRRARARLLASSRDMMNLLLIPVVCGLAAGAPLVLRIWAPKSFHPAELTPIVAIVAINAFPYGQFLSNLRALMSEAKTGRAAGATLVAATVNVGLNVVMIPLIGITGSAIATVLSYVLLARLIRPPASSGVQVPGTSVLLRTLIGAAVAVTLAIGLLPTSPVWLAIRLAMGAGALVAFVLLLRRAMAGFETSGRLVTRLLATKTGEADLKIPKLRRGSFSPSTLERRERIDRALFAVVMEAHVHRVSTHEVDDLVEALGSVSGISKSEVSRMCGALDAEMAAFRARPLGHVEFPYVFLGATHLKGRVGGQVASRAVAIATGVSMQGNREVLGLAVGDAENEASWTEFLRSLRARGLTGVRLVISDQHPGLKAAIATIMIGAAWQRCRVHFMRNVLAKVPRASAEMVAAAISTIFTQPDAAAVAEQFERVVATLDRQFPEVATLLAGARDDLLSFRAFPAGHWRKLWSANPLERLHREVKRRCDVVGVFPNDAAIERLVTAVIVETHDEWAVTGRRYLSETSMTQLRQDGPPALPGPPRSRRRLAG